MDNDCKRAGRWIGGCEFKARYDVRPSELVSSVVAEISRASDDAVRSILNGNIERIYVRDVCTRCGKTIERGEK